MATATTGRPPRRGWFLMWKILTLYWGITIAALGVVLIVAAFLLPVASAGLLLGGVVMIPTGALVAGLWFLIRRLPAPPSMSEVADRTQRGADIMQSLASAPEKGRIRSMGFAGKATILAVHDTGQRRGINPLIQLDMDVALDGRPAYRMQYFDEIAPIILGGIKPGKSLTIHVDQADQTKVVLDY